MAALLADGILRDLACRLSVQNYTPQTLSMALRLPEQEIMRRVATLREWGLVRFTTNDWHEKVIEAAPGEREVRRSPDGPRNTAKSRARAARAANFRLSPEATMISAPRTRIPFATLRVYCRNHLPCSPRKLAVEPGVIPFCSFKISLPLKMICGDVSLEMLRETDRYLRSNGQTGFLAKQINPSHPPIPDGALDCIFSFNAFHHFYPEKFLGSVRNALGENGLLFVYTRLKSQNAQSIWGKYFPDFAEKEVRLAELDETKRWSDCMTRPDLGRYAKLSLRT